MKIYKLVISYIFILILSSNIYSQSFKKEAYCNKQCWSSIAVYTTGSVLDINSSLNKYERYSFFQNDKGLFDWKKNLLFKSALVTPTFFFQKKYPKQMNVIRFIGGGVFTAVAIHNYQIKKVK